MPRPSPSEVVQHNPLPFPVILNTVPASESPSSIGSAVKISCRIDGEASKGITAVASAGEAVNYAEGLRLCPWDREPPLDLARTLTPAHACLSLISIHVS